MIATLATHRPHKPVPPPEDLTSSPREPIAHERKCSKEAENQGEEGTLVELPHVLRVSGIEEGTEGTQVQHLRP